jgi:hypothetical protein
MTCDLCVEHQNSSTLLISSPRVSRSFSWGAASFETRLSGWIRAVLNSSELDVRLGITTDLSGLQSSLPSIIQSSYDHDDDCNYKLRVHTVSLQPDGTAARVFAAAHYEKWGCGPFGLKNRHFEQNGSASLRLTPYVSNNSVALSTELLSVEADGLLGGLLQDQIVGPWLIDSLKNVIPPSISIGDVRSAIPPELRRYRIDLTSLRFIDRGGGRLGLYSTGRVQVSAQEAASIFAALQR